ncbi:sodium/potassium/calcium exchanger 4 isoform X2 [Macrosteles quadrilineatus]|uniref:sodium/potassium/calcium exchanger 4 isoform X2 n=1 Tax=Macrosteles quadrilineatus TaxID=74068 RepID=UPI0023E15D13|nr:sodium/potassium/calcium exchanger 4 isoform X2 [Macrosteles quadrilineatus]
MDYENEGGESFNNMNCTPPAMDDFPHDLFTEEQRRNGALVFHIATSLYLFLGLAIVCDKYFVPAVERICKALNMSNDVAGATFMAAATSAPELFVNVIGTFITEGDIGVGTIVGSAVFNILAVAACCGIGSGMVVPLHWWPLTRDCLAYGVTVMILICIIHDERVEWYEAMVLVALYTVYIAVMYWDKSFQKCTRKGLGHASKKEKKEKLEKEKQDSVEVADVQLAVPNPDTNTNSPQQNGNVVRPPNPPPPVDSPPTETGAWSILSFPYGKSWLRKVSWVLVLPIHAVFLVTIPDCEHPRFKKWFPITFLMCIIWIGGLSYVVAWMITVVGDTLKIPDSVMGITFLAAGTSVPEAVSSVIVAKQGHGSMGISNSLGSNTFDILLCLGLPWLIKASFLPTSAGHHFVRINSRGLEYSAISLLSTLLLLYCAFAINRFKLDRKVGYACLMMYGLFLVLATLIELNVFFTVNLPTCGRS